MHHHDANFLVYTYTWERRLCHRHFGTTCADRSESGGWSTKLAVITPNCHSCSTHQFVLFPRHLCRTSSGAVLRYTNRKRRCTYHTEKHTRIVRDYFGCEAELDKNGVVRMRKEFARFTFRRFPRSPNCTWGTRPI